MVVHELCIACERFAALIASRAPPCAGTASEQACPHHCCFRCWRSTDSLARAVAQKPSESLGQTAFVEHRPHGNTAIQSRRAPKSRPTVNTKSTFVAHAHGP